MIEVCAKRSELIKSETGSLTSAAMLEWKKKSKKVGLTEELFLNIVAATPAQQIVPDYLRGKNAGRFYSRELVAGRLVLDRRSDSGKGADVDRAGCKFLSRGSSHIIGPIIHELRH